MSNVDCWMQSKASQSSRSARTNNNHREQHLSLRFQAEQFEVEAAVEDQTFTPGVQWRTLTSTEIIQIDLGATVEMSGAEDLNAKISISIYLTGM
jgi:hypothetical protein